MKTIPTTHQLSEEEIKAAIVFWLSKENGIDVEGKDCVTFKTTRKDVALYSAVPRGGMTEVPYVMVISATVVESK